MNSAIHTILPGAVLPEGYFDEDNITFIQSKIIEILLKEFAQTILVSRNDIIRVMQSILEERRESIPKLNQRVIMHITSDFRRHQIEVSKHLDWATGFPYSQKLIDPIGQTLKYDQQIIKLNSQKKYDGVSRLGGTLRFHFT
jgi:hypothetical protein